MSAYDPKRTSAHLLVCVLNKENPRHRKGLGSCDKIVTMFDLLSIGCALRMLPICRAPTLRYLYPYTSWGYRGLVMCRLSVALIATVSTIGLAHVASAADMPVKA
ncbi:MAG: hypothetical protein WB522_08615, partial [Pseudolabrys sp.]